MPKSPKSHFREDLSQSEQEVGGTPLIAQPSNPSPRRPRSCMLECLLLFARQSRGPKTGLAQIHTDEQFIVFNQRTITHKHTHSQVRPFFRPSNHKCRMSPKQPTHAPTWLLTSTHKQSRTPATVAAWKVEAFLWLTTHQVEARHNTTASPSLQVE